MPPYDLTIRLRLELADDAEARELFDKRDLQRHATLIGDLNAPNSDGASAKLQRIYTDRPPRLLAQWPPGE